MTIAVNANPLMRYDAYYLLSDFWEAPSLQPRSFALGRWFLRRLLFGLKDPAPEFLPPLWKARFIIYAYVCWVYRFFLFLGIAVLVYHLFFKLLGIVLFLIEMVFFIGLPIFKELQVWWARRQDIWKSTRGRVSIAIFSLAFLGFIWPWSGAITSSGLLLAERQTGLYAHMPAIVVKSTSNQRPVKAGEVILELKSPELEEEAKNVKIESALLAAKLSSMSLNPNARLDFSVDWQSYQGLLRDQALYSRRINQLTLKAAFEGTVVDAPTWLAKGQWVTPGERLGTLISKNYVVAAYVKETDLSRLAKGNKGFFEPY
jgi:putative peptide zinc metalloprotease protein